MFKFLKRSASSRTTQNVVAAGGTTAALIAFVRTMWPELLPWDSSMDVTLAAVVTAVIGRVFAAIRTPSKAEDLHALTPPFD
jgi:hypothetical protein